MYIPISYISLEMKKIFFSVILFTVAIADYSQNKCFQSDIYSYLENTGVFELNQEEGHTPIIPYISVNEALINNRNNSSGYLSLNGTWKFHFADTPERSPDGFFSEGYKDNK
jgi:beta-galactosidase